MSWASWARVLVEPEHRRGAGGAGPGDGQLDPVADRGVLGLAHAPDVAGLDVVLHQHGAGLVDDPHGAVGGDLEGLVVRAVLLGLLRHEPDVGHLPIVAGSKAPLALQSSMTAW
jgi:hypothetical protein